MKDTVTILSYFFTSEIQAVKRSILFIHGAGDNVGSYSKMFKPLLANGFHVYALDWQSFGKLNGKPLQANFLECTKTAFLTCS